MHAKFPLGGGIEIEVVSRANDHPRGVEIMAHATRTSAQIAGPTIFTERVRVSAATARSIASALMGAAAEV